MGNSESSLAHEECEVAIIGAGPSGLAAASLLRDHDVSVVVIDEQARPGGQILRQPPQGFALARWLEGKLYARVKAALHAVEGRTDIDWRLQSTALGIMRPSPFRVQPAPSHVGHVGAAGPELWVQGPEGCYLLRAKAVLLAPGCHERPLPFPGWTLPGVMGAGALQGFLKSQQLIPGERFLLAGSHPLQLVVADQLLSAGASVAAVMFTQRAQQAAALLRHPLIAIRHTRQLLETAKILGRLRRAGVPLLFGRSLVRVDGNSAVEQATVARLRDDGAPDSENIETYDCDRVGVCYGFVASSELARQAGARMYWNEHAGGWLSRHDEWFESSVNHLFVAGEITGVDGADAALEKGRIAAAGILRSLGRVGEDDARALAGSARRRLSHLRSFAMLLQQLARPPADLALRTMTDDTILCRCESIRLGELRRQLAENKHVASTDATKLLTRVGMGLCQGRMCGDSVARVIAAQRGVPLSELQPFQAQAPVKPVALASLTRARDFGA